VVPAVTLQVGKTLKDLENYDKSAIGIVPLFFRHPSFGYCSTDELDIPFNALANKSTIPGVPYPRSRCPISDQEFGPVEIKQ
jgi:hypothetical protein